MIVHLELPTTPVYSAGNFSDAELLIAVEQQFTNPGPLLKLLIQRFERKVLGKPSDKKMYPAYSQPIPCQDGKHQPTDCPVCGSTLEVVASI